VRWTAIIPNAPRGTIIRREATPAGPRLVIELEFSQMFTRPVHRRTLVLKAPATARLLASENNDVHEITLAEDLDAPGAG
jgi:hypothetical protein